MQKKWTLDVSVNDNGEHVHAPSPIVQYNNNNSIYSGNDSAPNAMSNQISRGAAGDRYKVTRQTQEVFTNCPNTSLEGTGSNMIAALAKSPIIQTGLVVILAAQFISSAVIIAVIAVVALLVLHKSKAQ